MIVQQEVEYREIAGCPGYEVGSDGSVWSLRVKGSNAATRRNVRARCSVYRRPYGAKYCVVCLRPVPGGKVVCHYVHRIVLEAFVGPCPAGMLACHNDGDTSNNSVGNLRWDTQAGNMADKERHGTLLYGEAVPHAKLTVEDVKSIRRLAADGVSQKAIAQQFGISHVSQIVRMKAWRRVNGH